MSYEVKGYSHWPAWAVPFLQALIRTADDGHLRPGIAADLVGRSRLTPYWYRRNHPEFDAQWSEIAVYVRAVAQCAIQRRVNRYEKESELA